MALAKAIRFRHLATQLIEGDGVKFIKKLIKEHDDIVFDALFTYFTQSTDEEIKNKNDDANRILSQIIASRQKQSKAIESKATLTLDKLPSQIIGHAASFLPQQDYFNLS